jgi:hypothetical protein
LYGAVPPVAITVALPVEVPKHDTGTIVPIEALIGVEGSPIEATALVWHPLASVTVAV